MESEAAKGSEALLAASQEREAALASSLQELRGAMGDMADEAADKEDALRRQVRWGPVRRSQGGGRCTETTSVLVALGMKVGIRPSHSFCLGPF